MSTFLTDCELQELTGRKTRTRQAKELRRMGLVFWVNAAGRPVVPRSAIEARANANDSTPAPWASNKLKAQAWAAKQR